MKFAPELVSVVIPTYNGKADLGRLLPLLFSQQVDFPFEVICVDSSSSDGTWELLSEHRLARYRIPKSEFSHGGTRNFGIAKSKGEIVILMTQDAMPTDEHWMATLVRNYAARDVAGVYCRQLPRPDGTLLPKIDSALALTCMDARRENRLSEHADYFTKPPHERRFLCNFDDICSSVRRSVWEKFPFQPVSFAEDLEWSKRVFEAGYAIIFEAEAKVIHSHDRSFMYEFKRSFVTYDAVETLFGREEDGFGLPAALRVVGAAPWALHRVYPRMDETAFLERLHAYYLIGARALGHAFYNFWYRNLRVTELGQKIRGNVYRGV
jgi:rhamnosyltransferase